MYGHDTFISLNEKFEGPRVPGRYTSPVGSTCPKGGTYIPHKMEYPITSFASNNENDQLPQSMLLDHKGILTQEISKEYSIDGKLFKAQLVSKTRSCPIQVHIQ